MTDVRTAAAAYIARGLRPIPVWPPSAGCKCGGRAGGKTCESQCLGKVPRDPDWKDRSLPFAPSDFDADDNVALGMGLQPDGRWLVAIDYDGVPTVPWGELPSTLTTTTGRGKHYIYQTREAEPLGNWIDLLSARDKAHGYRPGHAGAVDLRFARGAVVAAPSLHRSGVRYRWVDEHAPIAELPRIVTETIYRERRRRGLPVASRWTRDGKRP